jgi:hypothetical protein
MSPQERSRRERVVFRMLTLLLAMVLLVIPATAPMAAAPDNLWPLFSLLGALLCAFFLGMLVGREAA